MATTFLRCLCASVLLAAVTLSLACAEPPPEDAASAQAPLEDAASDASGASDAATPVIEDLKCVDIRPLATRIAQPTKSAVAVAFSVATCEGKAVTGLATDDFDILEDDKPIVGSEASATILDRKAQVWVTLVLDNSPSVGAAGGVDAVADAAISFVESLFADGGSGVQVSVHFFSKKVVVKLDFSSDKAQIVNTLNAYRTDKTGSNTTNLYGGLISALKFSSEKLSTYAAKQREGVLLLGQVVMFTDGADLAAVASLEEAKKAVAASSDRVTMVAFGADADPKVLDQLSTKASFTAKEPEKLKELFAEVGARVAAERKAVYVLGYCSPKMAGQHQVKIALGEAGTSPPVSFNAAGWDSDAGAECSAGGFAAACKDAECGGLWCGGCAGACSDKLKCYCDNPKVSGKNCDQCTNGNRVAPACADCKSQFAGPNCDQCKNGSMSLPKCASCKPEFSGAKCDKCSVPNAAPPGCTMCKAGFTGSKCDKCANSNMALPDCTKCKAEFSGPKCEACANSNMAAPACTSCKPQFGGQACDKCANPNAVLPKCDACSNPNLVAPACTSCKPQFVGQACDKCANPNAVLPGCTSCKSAFKGTACDECANPNAASPGCSSCKKDFAGTKCDVCANPGKSLPACTSCKPEFAGKGCSECANDKMALPACKNCKPGFAGSTCQSCSNANKAPPACTSCKPQFAGLSCGGCADPKRALPDCKSCLKHLAGAACDSCSDSNHALPSCKLCKIATKVWPSCSACAFGWTGSACDRVELLANLKTVYIDYGAASKFSWALVSKADGKVLAAGGLQTGSNKTWSVKTSVPPGEYTLRLGNQATGYGWNASVVLTRVCGGKLGEAACQKTKCYDSVNAPVKVVACPAPKVMCSPPNCGDGNPCTSDTCNAVGLCLHESAPDGTACGSNMVCKAAKCVAAGGGCTPGKCSDGNACTTDTCDAGGQCQNKALGDGASCGSNLVCKAGKCVSAGAGAHFCDAPANCGIYFGENAPCNCDDKCGGYNDCCDASGKKPAGAKCAGSTCKACNP